MHCNSIYATGDLESVCRCLEVCLGMAAPTIIGLTASTDFGWAAMLRQTSLYLETDLNICSRMFPCLCLALKLQLPLVWKDNPNPICESRIP